MLAAESLDVLCVDDCDLPQAHWLREIAPDASSADCKVNATDVLDDARNFDVGSTNIRFRQAGGFDIEVRFDDAKKTTLTCTPKRDWVFWWEGDGGYPGYLDGCEGYVRRGCSDAIVDAFDEYLVDDSYDEGWRESTATEWRKFISALCNGSLADAVRHSLYDSAPHINKRHAREACAVVASVGSGWNSTKVIDLSAPAFWERLSASLATTGAKDVSARALRRQFLKALNAPEE
jgi:hypothetical protein